MPKMLAHIAFFSTLHSDWSLHVACVREYSVRTVAFLMALPAFCAPSIWRLGKNKFILGGLALLHIGRFFVIQVEKNVLFIDVRSGEIVNTVSLNFNEQKI
jgi:hypothetical protein